MYTSVLLGLAITLGAPSAKDPPKPDILGEWLAESFETTGVDILNEKENELEFRFTFAREGKVTMLHVKKIEQNTYKIDTNKTPAEIDIISPKEENDRSMRGIFKVEGDKLILFLVEGEDERPKKFESTKKYGGMLITFKRVKK